MTVSDAMRRVRAELEPRAGEDAAFEARQLLEFVTGGSFHRDTVLTRAQEGELFRLCGLRVSGRPLQYLLGEWAFMGLSMTVKEGVLIPRADTETLALAAEKAAGERGYRTALDLCCGSGCIGVALAKRAGLTVTAVDISADAVALTKENAERNGVTLDIRQGDLFLPVAGAAFDLIVTNPPYLSDGDMRSLQTEVRHEPALALYGGRDGLGFYRRIAAEYPRYLNKGGMLLMEIGSTQAEAVAGLFPNARVLEDTERRARVITVEGTCWTN